MFTFNPSLMATIANVDPETSKAISRLNDISALYEAMTPGEPIRVGELSRETFIPRGRIPHLMRPLRKSCLVERKPIGEETIMTKPGWRWTWNGYEKVAPHEKTVTIYGYVRIK